MSSAVAVELTPRIREILADTLEMEIGPDLDIFDTGRIDSLALVELIFAIEQEFSVSLPPEVLEIERFRTARSIAEIVATAHEAGGA